MRPTEREEPALSDPRTQSSSPAVSTSGYGVGTVAVAGTLGAVLVAASSWWVAAIPTRFRHERLPVLSWFGIGGAVPQTAFLLGLALTVGSWLLLGRLVLGGTVATRTLQWTAAAWTLPLLVAIPFGSRDLWAYAAQGDIVHRGLDPYVVSPQDVPGPFAAEVSPRWIDVPSPYGPAWLMLSRLVRAAGGDHVIASVFGYRLPVVAGVALTTWALPRIARRTGTRSDVALWLGVTSPVTLLLGVGGGHNDLLMAGLMLAGVAAAVSDGGLLRAVAAAGALCALGAAVKAPAVVVAAFAVPLWLEYSPGARRGPGRRGRRVLLACAAVLASFVVVFAGLTAVSGWGLGWAGQLGPDAPVVSWLSLPTALALLWKLAHGITHGTREVDATMRDLRSAGTVLTVAVLVWAWFAGLRHRSLTWCVVALVALIFLSPSVQPWYLCWVLPLAGLLPLRRGVLIAIVAATVGGTIMIHPNGTGVFMEPVAAVLVPLSVLLAWLTVPGNLRWDQRPV